MTRASRQPDLFAPPPDPNAGPKRKLRAMLNRVEATGRVNGMTKAELRRRYPKRLPMVTKP